MTTQSNFRQSNLKQPRQTKGSQQGVALIVSLIILVSLTLLGLTTMQRATTDLAMAGNQRESGLMFQAAEIGLIVAERQIQASTTNEDFSNTTSNNDEGLYTVMSADDSYHSPNYFDKTTWGTKSTKAGALAGVSEEPRYMIEYMGDRTTDSGGLSLGGYGGLKAGEAVSVYRATSRGVGLTGNSFRYVQSYYGKTAP